MPLHIIKIFLRNLVKRPGNYIIIVVGLVVGFTASFAILLYIQDELSYDHFHENAEQIYRLTMNLTEDGVTTKYAPIPPAFARDLQQEFPAVRRYVRMRKTSGVVGTTAEYYQENHLLYVDSTFFNIFSFDLESGNSDEVLNDPNSVVLTASLARKYFGSDNPVGQTLRIRLSFQTQFSDMTVTGVAQNPPEQSHFDFDMLISMNSLSEDVLQSYSNTQYYSYLLVRPDVSSNLLQSQFQKYITRVSGPEAAQWLSLELQPLTNIHLQSDKVAEFDVNGSVTSLLILAVIALVILSISSVNFVNIFIAQATGRVHEIQVRKVCGAPRRVLIWQFLMEALLLTMIAGILSLTSLDIILPYLENITGKTLTIRSTSTWLMPVSILVVCVVVGFVSGLFPAFIISGRKLAVSNKYEGISRTTMTGYGKGLIVMQFMFSTILIACTVVSIRQFRYTQTKDLGFVEEQLMVLPNQLHNPDRQTILDWKSRLTGYPGIQSVTVSSSILGEGIEQSTFVPEGHSRWESRTMRVMYVDAKFLETYGISLLDGRDFSDENSTEENAFILNESAVNSLGWTDAVGKKFMNPNYNIDGTVVGVIEDIHYSSLHQQIEPMVLSYLPERLSAITVRVSPRNLEETIKQIRGVCSDINPAQPFEYRFLDQQFAQLYEQDRRLMNLVQIFTVLSIGVACLGLYGLTVASTNRRTKEVGVRKVLGATAGQILLLLSKDYLSLVIGGFLLAAPVSYLIMQRWLQNFAYHVELTVWPILISGFLGLLMASMTISIYTFHVALMNPVDSIRYE